jgi:hypothetical protein
VGTRIIWKDEKMANNKQYIDAIARVKSGHASKEDHELADRASKTVGYLGSSAREAQREGAKKSR